MILAQLVTAAEEVDRRISYGVGASALLILVGLLVILVAFGGGRDHS